MRATRRLARTAQLRAALDETLDGLLRTSCRVRKLARRFSNYSSSSPIEELDVQLDDGTALELVFKDLSTRARLQHARRVRPAFLYAPCREIDVYRTILEPSRLGTATWFGSVVERRTRRHWLFLERVSGALLWQVGEFFVWEQVARWLAALHSRFAGPGSTLTPEQAAHLLNYDRDFYGVWIQRAKMFARRAESRWRPRAHRQRIAWLASRYDVVVEQLAALPVTLIHGDFYPSNVLIATRRDRPRICPVDWELAAIGPGLIDLAALTAGKWTDEQRAALVTAYLAALKPCHGWPPARDEFMTALEYCRLHLGVQMLGWSERWSPPAAHTQDWLGEAMQSAERLGL
jgi:hypothetical protein